MNKTNEKRRFNIRVAMVTLVLLSLIIASVAIFAMPNKKAEAIRADKIAEQATDLGNMLLNGYADSTNKSGKVFNGNVFWELIDKVSGGTVKDKSGLSSLGATPRTSADFREYNEVDGKKKDVVVTINGKQWIATYLSRNTAGDPILTFWMANSNITSKWGNYNTNSRSTYVAACYGTSYMRTTALNNGGSCTTSTTAATTVGQNSDSTWAIYTMSGVTGSLTRFMEKPTNMSWQHTQKAKGTLTSESYTKTYNYNNSNDALDNVMGNDVSSSNYKYEGMTGYTAWGNDYLWLPSIVETGSYGEEGIWKADNSTRANSGESCWTRSAYYDNYYGAYLVNNSGAGMGPYGVMDGTRFIVRPAFHLNLKEVEKYSSISLSPDDIERAYNSSEQGVEDEEWYVKDLDDIATVKYYVKDSSVEMTTKPTTVGEYEVEIQLSDYTYHWDGDINKLTTKIPFVITKRKIELPKFIDDEDALPFNGGDDVYFQLEVSEDCSDYIKIEVPDKHKNEVNYNADSMSFTAQKVGKYEIPLSLLDTDNTEWASSNQKLKFEVTKAIVAIAITDDSSSSALTGEKGSKIDVNLDMDHNLVPHDNHSVEVTIYASADKLPTLKISDAIVLTNAESSYPLRLDLTSLRAGVQYKLEARVTSEEYTIELETTTLDVTEVPTRVVLTWELYSDGSKVRGVYIDKLLSDTDKTVSLDNAIGYDGKAYSLKAKLPNGYSLDTSKGTGGYKIVCANANNTNVGTNADKYTTTLWLKNKSDNSVEEYSITWEIEKAKYDLSKIKWEYDGKLPYDKLNSPTAILDPKTMPEGLLAEYEGNTGDNKVGTYGTAYVTFKLDDEYEENYIIPDEYDPETYIDEDKDFEWTKTWSIVKARIQTGSWKNATQTDSNGNAFDIKVLRDPLADGGIVTYEYYETDSTGKKISETAIRVEDIVYSDSETKFYIAKPVLVDKNNYELDDSNAESRWFKVGRALTKVTVVLDSNELEYNTNPRHVKLIIGGESILPTNAFELSYYEGYSKLNDAPKEVGKYRVEVTLKSDYADKYEIDGDYDFEFEIVKGKISTEWNTQAKPNVLNLKYGQINGVEYEIVDSEDNIVDYKDLQAGNTYRIRAKIKQDQRNRFIFVDGSVETDWQEFSVSNNDNLTDPNDPNNRYYPAVDPELPTQDPNNPDNPPNDNNGGNGGGTLDEILDKIKDLPLWQIIAGAISIILTIIFLSMTASYESKRKEAKRLANDKYKAYYAGAFLGLAVTGWTAIACALIGVAAVSFVIMLIAKSRYKKAEKEKEYAKDEYEKSEARQRDENMRMMFMSMLGGNNGNMGQGGYMGGYGLGADEMRGLIAETVTALLPNAQQALPQQASYNDEVIHQIMKNQEELAHNQEMLIKKMQEQPTEKVFEKVVAREVAVANANDETIKSLIEGQKAIMQQLVNLSTNQSQQPQVVEKIIEKEVPVEIEKIVEKIVEVPVEVEKIVEKEVIKEVPVEIEKIVEVEKKVIKEVKVEVPVAAPPKPKKEVAPKLTLDEAYALLSKEQKKYFDGLKAYALSKDKCKEKKSTYFTVFGVTTANPILKLTIKKDTTVALLKMEDEFMKDLRRDASGDGTKVKVKETEIVVSDAQAFDTAKKMIDLREDQIERYNDLLKEQRSVRSKK